MSRSKGREEPADVLAAAVIAPSSSRGRRALGALFVTIMLAGGWALLRGYQSPPVPPAPAPAPAPLGAAHDVENPRSPPPVAVAPAPAPPRLPTVAPPLPPPPPPPEPMLGALAPPSVADLRAEVEANPHAVPPSYIAWATALSEEMGAADHDAGRARHTFGRLLHCLDGQPADTVAAVCLRSARELVERQPSWRAELMRREARVSARVKLLSED